MLQSFIKKIESKEAVIGIIGLGYVGLPLGITFARAGYRVIGFDNDAKKVTFLNEGKSYLEHIPAESFSSLVQKKLLLATDNFSNIKEVDAIIVCVPTPLNDSREPDLSFVENAAKAVSPYLKKGQLFSLESSTYPGTTDELVRQTLEKGSGLVAGKDFFLIFSPEREDPGNPNFHTKTIPKIVGGLTPDCLEAGVKLYGAAVDKVVPVSSARTAEMVKLFENIYRAVNIALVNELKLISRRLNIDVWEVIQAAATKPFGFQAFWPGPGLGGHCIPIDPFYLTWKARQVDFRTRFIELAGEINTNMPYHVVERISEALNQKRKSLNGSSVLVLGVAYKPDIDDMRESPALKIIDLLQGKGARVLYHDPHVPALHPMHKFNFDMKSVPLTESLLQATDCVVVVINHKNIDYTLVAHNADLVIDSRHVVPRDGGNVIEA